MLRIIGAVALSALLSTTAQAQTFACPVGRADVLEAVRWTALKYEGRTAVRLGVNNPGAKGVQMVDADAFFVDALGEVIGGGGLPIERDFRLAPRSGNISFVDAPSFERLTTVDPELVKVTICVRALLYEDGTADRF